MVLYYIIYYGILVFIMVLYFGIYYGIILYYLLWYFGIYYGVIFCYLLWYYIILFVMVFWYLLWYTSVSETRAVVDASSYAIYYGPYDPDSPGQFDSVSTVYSPANYLLRQFNNNSAGYPSNFTIAAFQIIPQSNTTNTCFFYFVAVHRPLANSIFVSIPVSISNLSVFGLNGRFGVLCPPINVPAPVGFAVSNLTDSSATFVMAWPLSLHQFDFTNTDVTLIATVTIVGAATATYYTKRLYSALDPRYTRTQVL